ncbi:hypothetical protein NECAME_06510 [Necator americanus]|uniref:Uncharacterized protein n=1 Tax=Necator americanus TaxID=51031 RepID=W2TT05_NECAM|nr:hypothetical protein NECAME_06510 [Necator americanus]ETN85215.1 hypothetical protein NECAME_06510 [Necator americanus]
MSEVAQPALTRFRRRNSEEYKAKCYSPARNSKEILVLAVKLKSVTNPSGMPTFSTSIPNHSRFGGVVIL